MYSKIFSVTILVIIFSACSLFQGDSFSGIWKMTMTGDLNDETEFVVKEDNSLSFELMVTVEGRTFPVLWKGDISEDGKLKGGIYLESERVGSFSGTIDFSKGEGEWKGGNYSGKWTTIKTE